MQVPEGPWCLDAFTRQNREHTRNINFYEHKAANITNTDTANGGAHGGVYYIDMGPDAGYGRESNTDAYQHGHSSRSNTDYYRQRGSESNRPSGGGNMYNGGYTNEGYYHSTQVKSDAPDVDSGLGMQNGDQPNGQNDSWESLSLHDITVISVRDNNKKGFSEENIPDKKSTPPPIEVEVKIVAR